MSLRIESMSVADVPDSVRSFLYEYLYKPWGVP
jgi:hypothetical protein